MSDLKQMPDAYWRERLTPEQYEVCRLKGTERPFSGALYWNREKGVYSCVACEEPLFLSDDKFDAGCGWPSFDRPLSKDKVEYHEDLSHGMRRVEVTCAKCGAHLGHVFDDGPRDTTGLRFCINSVSLNFDPQKSGQQSSK